MKTRTLSLGVLLLIGQCTISAQSVKKEKFEVAGNCGICKVQIEGSAKSVDGVKSGKWDEETKIFTLVYDSNQVNIQKVHKAIARAGYDTKMVQASRKTYKELPECCKYERMREDLYKMKLSKIEGIGSVGIEF
jgi:periplasmic mercuric ion binding protein